MQNSKPPTRCLYSRLFVATVVLLATVVNLRADYQSLVLADGPVAFYPLNLNVDTGSVISDISGNGNNGTNVGNQVITTNGPSPYITNAANFDPAFYTAINLPDASSVPSASILNFSGPITMEAWVQPVSPTVGSGPPADILGKGYDGTNEMTLRANGGYYFGGTYSDITGGANANGGQETTNWTHLVSTYDGTNWNLYVNGQLVGQGADSIGAINFPDPWAIGVGTTATAGGNSGSARFFNGNITEVALYTNSLTLNQVLAHYFMGLIGVMPSNAVPIIIAQTQPQSAYAGGTVTFSADRVSPLVTTNQWYKNGVLMSGKTNLSLTLTNLQSGDAANYNVRFGNVNGSTNSVSASLTILAAGNLLEWTSNANSGVWDAGNSANWLNVSNSTQVAFNSGDQVVFDDTPGVPTNVTINGTVTPSIITVNSSTNYFSFNQGTSPLIGGAGNLFKSGSSQLQIFSPQGLSGAVTISGGSIYAGNNCFHQVASITITNNATLDLGGGTLVGNKPITVSGSGVNGEGAIINSYNDYPGQLVNIALAGDTLFGSFARWDLAGGSQISGPHFLTLDWSGNTGTTGGDGNTYGEWTSVTIGANVAGITLTNGSKLGSHNMDTAFQNTATVITVQTNSQLIFWNGGWNGTIHLLNGGQSLQFGAPGAFNGSTAIMEDGAQWNTYGGGGDQSINVAITLNGVAHFVVGDHNRIYTNLISGAGGFVSDYYNHASIFAAANTYSGPTIIGDGPQVWLTGNGSISHSSLIFFGGSNPTSVHLDVSGRSDQTLTLASGQTLGGIGAINGSLTVGVGATISPAGTNTTIGITTGSSSTGTIIATNAVTLNGTTVLKLNGSGVNDEVQAGAGITYGGTLNLVNISGAPYAIGNLFQVFSATSYNSSFTSVTPATPGAGLAWILTNGFLSVVAAPSQPVVNSVRVSSGNLIFSGTNGTLSGSYMVLTSTNLTTPLANWVPVLTNNYDASGNFSVTNAIVPGVPDKFYLLKQ